MQIISGVDFKWARAEEFGSKSYVCGYCGKMVASNKGWYSQGKDGHTIHICPFCSKPTYSYADEQTPGIPFGNTIDHLPTHIEHLYNEARNCMVVSAFTSAVLACRKMLVHIAVEQGADPDLKFFQIIDYLADRGFIPPNGRGWVNVIRTKGNYATHEIVLMSREDAEQVISFTEMLLKFIFEFPAKAPSPPSNP